MRVVLDVNIPLIANPASEFQEASDWELVLTEGAFEEFYLHREKGEQYSREAASRGTFTALSTARSIAPVILFVDPIRFEIEVGSSASASEVERLVVPPTIPILSETERRDMQKQMAAMNSGWQFAHPGICEQAYQGLRCLQADGALFPRLANLLGAPETANKLQEAALLAGREYAAAKGWHVAETFKPCRDWLHYGYHAADMAYTLWKYARHGDGTPARPASHSYDLTYVGHMAICDGIVSNDSTVLKMAWACWPEKQQNIWTYDRERGKFVQYLPPWEI